MRIEFRAWGRATMRIALGIILGIALVGAALAQSAAAELSTGEESRRWMGADGEYLPFQSDEEILAFLGSAEAERVKELTTGVNRPLKVLLRKDGILAHAIFRTVDIKKTRFETQKHVYLDFRDSYVYECAAYEMSRLLGIDNVPPCVTSNDPADDLAPRSFVFSGEPSE